MKYIQEITKKKLQKLTPESAPKIDLDEAAFLGNKSYSVKESMNSIKLKEKGVQSHNKHTSEDFINCSEENETKCGVNCPLRSNKREFSMVKQPKKASILLDDKVSDINKLKSVP